MMAEKKGAHMIKRQLFIAISFLTLSLSVAAEGRGFLEYCNAEFPGQITEAEAITVGYLKLAFKYKGPMPFKISTKRIYGENGEVLREMEGVNSFFWYAHPSDFNNKFSSVEEVKDYLLSVFKDKSKCQYINEKLQTKVENLELSMPPIEGRNGLEVPFKLTTLSPLNGAQKLKRLNVIGHAVSGKDMEPLNLPSLEELKMTDSEIEDITFLKDIKSLKILSLGKNKIKDISPLSSLINLEDVELYNNQIRDLSPLKNSTKIFFLSLGGNHLENISPLKDLVRLNFLSLQSNRHISGEFGVIDISSLENMIAMRELNLRDNKIVDLSPIANLKNLIRLNVSRNQINDCNPLFSLKQSNRSIVIVNVKNECK
jgi:Leucine Rich repeats (2 copies)